MAVYTTLSFLGLVAAFRPAVAPTDLAPNGAHDLALVQPPLGFELPPGDRRLPVADAAAAAAPTSAYVLKRRSQRRRGSGYARRAEARM